MIDLNKIRSLTVLDDMRGTICRFLNFDRAELLAVYDAEGEGVEDYEADREAAEDLLAKVERRMKSLGNHLARETKTPSDAPKTEVGSSAS